MHSEKLGELAREYEAVHSVKRALQMGALHEIIPASELRGYLVRSVAAGVHAELALASGVCAD